MNRAVVIIINIIELVKKTRQAGKKYEAIFGKQLLGLNRILDKDFLVKEI